jgi:AcrR family transcriptional regulator
MPPRISPPPRARRTQADRSAATRDALVAAARQLFAEQGFADVPTDKIVAAAGVTRGALYHQFTDKTALFDAVMEAVEADIARRLADAVHAAGISDPVEALRHAVRTWLDICIEPEIHRIALIDGPSVLGWVRWREVCQRHVFGLVQTLLEHGIALGLIRDQPARPLAHALMGAGDEAALYVAEAVDPAQARAEMIGVLDQLIAGVTVFSPMSRNAPHGDLEAFRSDQDAVADHKTVSPYER